MYIYIYTHYKLAIQVDVLYCRRMNEELEAKTAELVKEAEHLVVSSHTLVSSPDPFHACARI